MTYTIGLATTFHDPAVAILDPQGRVLFAEASERHLQYKRAPNCEPDSIPYMERLVRRYVPRGATVRIATSWSAEFTGFLEQMSRAGTFTLDSLLKLSPDLNRSLVPERTERALIASVIYNRLNAGMPLGIDASILYAYPDHEGAPTADMLADPSPYNTRLNTGLPPTPIANPGIASINAALYPESTGYYYYALDTATGQHRFFTNADEFNAFVATQNYE